MEMILQINVSEKKKKKKKKRPEVEDHSRNGIKQHYLTATNNEELREWTKVKKKIN